MHITVNGARLFFDVDGEGLTPDGPRMRQKPTLLLLHGGPGGDHGVFKPAFTPLRDVARLVYLDHRGNGRSEYTDPETWNLPQWGNDIRAFCDTLGIIRPIVLGYSFGGFVAQSYATRHPNHLAGLILLSTSPKIEREEIYDTFERLGGAPPPAQWPRRAGTRPVPPRWTPTAKPASRFTIPRNQKTPMPPTAPFATTRWRCISPAPTVNRAASISVPRSLALNAQPWSWQAMPIPSPQFSAAS